MDKIFGSKLGRILYDLGISQPTLAKSIKVSTNTVNSWVTHDKMPRLDNLFKIMEFLESQYKEKGLDQFDQIQFLIDINPNTVGKYKTKMQEYKEICLNEIDRIKKLYR